MKVNKATLEAMSSNIHTTFQKSLGKVENKLVNKLYNEQNTTSSIELIKSLDGFGLMKEFKSERRPGVVGEVITVAKPVKFERTIEIPREDIEDDNMGYIPSVVNSIAIASERTPIAKVVEALTLGFTEKCNDGKTFFHTSRGNLQTGALTAENLKAARTKLAAQTDSEGQPLGFMADTLVVGVNNQSAAEEIINAQQINGTSNTLYHALDLVVSPYINDDSWYVVDSTEGVYPIVLVMRVKPDKIVSKDDLNSDKAFDRDVFSWGTRGRFVAAYHNPKLIVGSTGA